MRTRTLIAGLGLLLLASSASAAAELPSPPKNAPPEPDITPMKLMGANARAKNGPEPLAAPPEDVGMTPDPDEVPGGKRDDQRRR